ncbi:MAG TPA: hypothetical protein P5044_05275, partial [bacterium]|nr:hypothetical protein [bacterium]
MRKLVLLISVLFIVPAFAQESDKPQSIPSVDESAAETKAEEPKAEEPKAEEPKAQEPAPVEPAKVTMTKEEIKDLVQKMVAEELAKKEAEKKAEEAKKAEDNEKSEKEKGKRLEKDGLIQPGYSKNSVTFIMGDDNLLDNSQYSPAWDIGPRYEYEDFAERVYGYSNNAKSSTSMSLFFEEDGLLKNLTARMSLSLKMTNSVEAMNNSIKTGFGDSGSFVEIDYKHPSTNRFKLTFYPYNAEKIAIGNYRGLKWGSNRMLWPQSSLEPVPGFQALYGYGDLSVYFGFKANAQYKSDKLATEMVAMETVYGFFGGVTYNNKKLGLKAHLQGAYIDKGDNVNIPEYMLEDRDDDTIKSYGFDAFIRYNYGSELGDPIGINTFADGSWLVPDYSSKFAFRVGAEYLFQNERLQNADYLTIQNEKETEPITDNFFAHGAAVELGARYKGIRAIFMYTYRDLPFMSFDAPGVVPFQTISSEAGQSPEHLFTISADYHIWDLWFGVTYGYKIPATYTVYDANGQKNVTVLRERLTTDAVTNAFDRSRELIKPGNDALDIMFIRANIKYQFSNSVIAMLEYSFMQDHNR